MKHYVFVAQKFAGNSLVPEEAGRWTPGKGWGLRVAVGCEMTGLPTCVSYLAKTTHTNHKEIWL
jgi:hypothetical protein